MRKVFRLSSAAGAAAAGVLTLAGCNGPAPAVSDSNYSETFETVEHTVKLEDRRSVICLSYRDGKGGISCDWEEAK